jgi:hypothetical protein
LFHFNFLSSIYCDFNRASSGDRPIKGRIVGLDPPDFDRPSGTKLFANQSDSSYQVTHPVTADAAGQHIVRYQVCKRLTFKINHRDALPDFPLPLGAWAPLRAKAEQQGISDFTPFWSGQASPLAREMPARELTLKLVQETVDRLRHLGLG